MAKQPQVVVIGGPNGAGKTTVAREVLSRTLGIAEFVNADAIAAGLSGFDPERAAFAAGRVMLARLHELAEAGESFAFESTLASRSFAPWLKGLIARGFAVHVLYVWLKSPSLAVARVKARVKRGGHGIPAGVIRRRYGRSAANFVNLYRPLAEASGGWIVYDNSETRAEVVAQGVPGRPPIILSPGTYARLLETAHGAGEEEGQGQERD